jgi:hypothetical protein
MKTLIYQFWIGQRPPYSLVSEKLFRAYGERIGADYLFADQPIGRMCLHKRYFGALRPIFDASLHIYDGVLFVDMDVIPVDGVTENIFDEIRGDLMMAEETDQPLLRKSMVGNINSENDHKWASAIKRRYGTDVPRTADGLPKVFNSGVVLYSGDGLSKLQSELPRILLYQMYMARHRLPRFYMLDQNYLGAFLAHKSIDFQKLDSKWNSQVTSVSTQEGGRELFDYRTPQTRFIHMQHGPQKPQMTQDDALAVSIGNYQF